MTDKLKPCPFCGNVGPSIYEDIHSYGEIRHFTVECDACSATVWGVPYESEGMAIETAVERWNRREGVRYAD